GSMRQWRLAPNNIQRCSVAFFFNYLVSGLIGPFMSPLLLAQGFSHGQVSLIVAGSNVCCTIMPLVAGRIAENYQQTRRVVAAASVLMLLASVCLWLVVSFRERHPHSSPLLFVGCFLALSLCRAPLGSLLDSVAMQVSRSRPGSYGRIRMCGSLAFAVAASAAGYTLGDGHLRRFFPALCLLAALTTVMAHVLPEERRDRPRQASDRAGFWRSLRRPFWFFIAATMLHWCAFSPYQYGFSLYLQEQAFSSRVTGALWSLAVLAEVVCFALCPLVLRTIRPYHALGLAFAASGVRWMLLGTAPALPTIVVAQLLHGPGFALYISAALQILSSTAGGRFSSSFQGLYATMVSGLAACVGTLVAGFVHSRAPFHTVLAWMAPLELVALLVLWVGHRAAVVDSSLPKLSTGQG
ncbi:MAG: hypothetical protein EOO40_05920, partial [Deltaproteobacteria bacterium]